MNVKKMKLPMMIIAVGMLLAVVSCLLVGIRKEPVIKAHDFKYAVTYKLDGEVKTVEGVFKCRFNGYGGSDDPTLRNYVGEHTVNGNALESFAFTIAQKDGVELSIITALDAAYLMGDADKYEYESGNEDPYLEAIDAQGMAVEVSEVFDVEIISWEYPDPIGNSFEFAGFSVLYAGSMLAMLLVALLTIIVCVIFVKKDQGVSYKVFDKISAALNFMIGFAVIPFITVVVFFLDLTMDSESLIYQIYLCVPAITAFTIAASMALRRKGFTKSGLLVQLAGPTLFFAQIFLVSLVQNLFS